jgi:hypothetical protein
METIKNIIGMTNDTEAADQIADQTVDQTTDQTVDQTTDQTVERTENVEIVESDKSDDPPLPE